MTKEPKTKDELVELREHYETLICMANMTAEIGSSILAEMEDGPEISENDDVKTVLKGLHHQIKNTKLLQRASRLMTQGGKILEKYQAKLERINNELAALDQAATTPQEPPNE